MIRLVTIILLATVCLVSRAAGQDTIQISSGLNEPVRLWLLPRGEKDWSRPPVFLPRSGSVGLRFAHQSDYWLVAKDLSGDEDHLGWVDLPKLAKLVPPVELVIGGGYVTTVKEMTRTVTVYVTKEEKHKQIVFERIRAIGPNGRVRYICVEREVEVTTTLFVPEKRLERIQVQVRSLRVELSLNQNGKNIPIDQFLKKDGSEK